MKLKCSYCGFEKDWKGWYEFFAHLKEHVGEVDDIPVPGVQGELRGKSREPQGEEVEKGGEK